jgi:transcription antitermination factor NusG
MAKLGQNPKDARCPSALSDAEIGASQWYAVNVYMRSELQVAAQLSNKGVEAFLPSFSEVRKWSDRTKIVVKPLIPGYVFLRAILSGRIKLQTLETVGVRSFVSFAGVSPAIPDVQILHLKQLTENNICGSSYPGLITEGQRVRVRSGCLAGLEGTLITTRQGRAFAVCIQSIRYTFRISADHYDFEFL